MTSIQLTLTGAQARAEVDGVLTAGMVGVPVTIVWDESWNGLVKTLVCRSDGCMRTILNVGSHATVAPEVFRTEKWAPNALYLGVEGRDAEGKLVIPSTFAYCGQILPGAVAEGTISQEPENPAWAKILGLIGDMGTLATAQKANLVEAINEAAGLSTSQRAVTSVNGNPPDSTGNVTLTAAQTGAVPLAGGTMTGPLKLVSPTASAHGANKAYVDSAVSKAAPANLLDNSDFRNPVNQRGQSSYSLDAWGGYMIDRWKASDIAPTVTLGSNGIDLVGSFYQVISEPARFVGRQLTLAAKVDGTVYCSSGTVQLTGEWHRIIEIWPDWGCIELNAQTNNSLFMAITANKNVTIEWAALYEGEYTADTLPEYHPKGYGAELAECQRYYYKISGDPTLTGYVASTETRLLLGCPQAAEMRINPSVVADGNCEIIQGGAYFPATVTTVETSGGSLVVVVDYGESAAPEAKTPCCLYVQGGIELSAEL